MVPLDKLAQITERFEFLEAQLNAGAAPADIARISKEYTDLKPVVDEIRAYRGSLDDLAEAEAMLADPEMKALAEEEMPRLKARIPEMEQALRLALLPKDSADARPAIIEIRPGTGGDEAALFAGDLARMYQRHAEKMGWRWDVLEEQASDLGGLKELVALVSGEGVFARLKYESGVHRVQRVPTTEAQGRVHTSAATVAVLPEADAVEIDIPASDIRIDTMRSSGAGGQHVNTTDSAVRITHIPSGIGHQFRKVAAPQQGDRDAGPALTSIRGRARAHPLSPRSGPQKPDRLGRSQRADPDLQLSARPDDRPPDQPDALCAEPDHGGGPDRSDRRIDGA